jgi:hypothetical protein
MARTYAWGTTISGTTRGPRSKPPARHVRPAVPRSRAAIRGRTSFGWQVSRTRVASIAHRVGAGSVQDRVIEASFGCQCANRRRERGTDPCELTLDRPRDIGARLRPPPGRNHRPRGAYRSARPKLPGGFPFFQIPHCRAEQPMCRSRTLVLARSIDSLSRSHSHGRASEGSAGADPSTRSSSMFDIVCHFDARRAASSEPVVCVDDNSLQ